MSQLLSKLRQSLSVIGRARRAGIDAPRRHLINVVVFLILSMILIVYVARSLLFVQGGVRTLSMEFADVTGISIRNDVTMRGVPIGLVSDFELTRRGTVQVEVTLDPGVTVPQGTKAIIMRRSAIGDVTLEMNPGDGPPIPSGGRIPISDTELPPAPERTIEILQQVLESVPPSALGTLVSELADAVRGRGEDLATLSVAGADLAQQLVGVQQQLESLIRNGPKVTGVLADNADVLADDIKQTALLADILRDRRFDLVDLSKNSAELARLLADVIVKDKANLACLVSDLGRVNAAVAEPENLENLKGALALNRFFFDAVVISVVKGNDGLDWFRVHLLTPQQQPPANAYQPHRPPPDVFAANSCRSIYGRGVGPASQPDPVHLSPGTTLYPGR